MEPKRIVQIEDFEPYIGAEAVERSLDLFGSFETVYKLVKR
jgi:hypothetical protein